MRVFFPSSIVILAAAASCLADEPISLAERFQPGYEYRVVTQVKLNGELSIPVDMDKKPQLVKMTGECTIDYDERVLPVKNRDADQTSIRFYRSIDFSRVTGDQPQRISLRPEVKRLVIMKRGTTKVPFSPDGALTWGEIDMLRTDVFIPALGGLLPQRPVKAGDTWTVAEAAVAELTDMDKIEDGRLTGKLELLETINGRQVAHVSLAGELTGINEDGPNRQKLSGKLYFDIKGAFISYLSINGEHYLLDKDGKVNGKIAGEYVLVRQQSPKNPKLADDAIEKLGLEPNPGNTLLLFEEPDLGVRMLHPRNWRVGRQAKGQQITLDETNGSGILITIEPLVRVPTADAYLQEAQKALEQKQTKINRVSKPVRISSAPNELDLFSFDALDDGQQITMHYLIARQPNAGATFAARIIDKDRDELLKQVERIARSLTLSRKLPDK